MTHCFVGFDTSNYTTSVAVCDREGAVLANLKTPLPVQEGQRGLRQSDAVFAHTRNLPELCQRLGAFLKERDLCPMAVGVSTRPRDAEGSYMPCFLAGRAAAHAFAAASALPVYEFSHQNGHVMAALYSSGKQEMWSEKPFLAFHVSGGTTEALLVEPKLSDFQITLVGETDDINAGQLIDRVGVAMGISFPCGREMERLAASFTGKLYRHPVCVREGRCSLSGAENIALRLLKETDDKSAVAAFVFDFICRTLLAMGEQAEARYGAYPILFAGGVMSNHLMRQRLSERFDAAFAEPAFSADNAAGIALLCWRAAMGKESSV
ncbi:MAG: peptidase M22 [Clostridia bacterium]|nr:peptidase M22 [Clostridia bacterium]